MKKEMVKRIYALLAVVTFVFAVFALRLVQWQVVQGGEYRELSNTTSSDSYVITAARGEIVDRYGRPLATNRVGFNVTLNKSYLEDEDINQTILSILSVLNESEEEWQDSTPMAQTAPYTFLKDEEGSTRNQAAIERLKTKLGLNIYATEQNVLDKMIERYDLQEVPENMRRIVGGIRYEMELREYGYSNPFTLAVDVSIKTVSTLKENSMELPGVDIVEESIREYPDGTIMPHALGRVGPIYKEEYEELKNQGYKMNDIIGISGIESAFESELRGTDGLMQVQRSKLGEILSQEVVTEPLPGNTVVLTIDKMIQQTAQTSLENMIKYYQGTTKGKDSNAGAVVVINVKTGEILAMATYPSYDLNLYSQNYYEYLNTPNAPLFDRATAGLYRPGSTFKPIVGTAGLMNGVIDAHSTVICTGVYGFWANTGFAPTCLHHHGALNVEGALRESCNIFFYDVGRRVGIDAFNEVATAHGFGQATGIEIPEQVGALTSKERTEAMGQQWQAGDVVQAAIGQMNTTATPLQLAVYAATLANDGVRNEAHLVQAVRSYNYETTIYTTEPKELSRLEADPNVTDTIRNGMVAASMGYSGQFFGNYPIQIASKTGTAQANTEITDCLMIAYGPVEDPEIAVAVVVEKSYDSYKLGQVVTDIFDAYYFSENEQLAVQQSNALLP